VPESAIVAGVGNPFSQGALNPGERVVDFGSGGGFDCFVAAEQVGPEGRVVGVDMTDEMLERSRSAATAMGLGGRGRQVRDRSEARPGHPSTGGQGIIAGPMRSGSREPLQVEWGYDGTGEHHFGCSNDSSNRHQRLSAVAVGRYRDLPHHFFVGPRTRCRGHRPARGSP
jgi:SAM-dependent methyltransferase